MSPFFRTCSSPGPLRAEKKECKGEQHVNCTPKPQHHLHESAVTRPSEFLSCIDVLERDEHPCLDRPPIPISRRPLFDGFQRCVTKTNDRQKNHLCFREFSCTLCFLGRMAEEYRSSEEDEDDGPEAEVQLPGTAPLDARLLLQNARAKRLCVRCFLWAVDLGVLLCERFGRGREEVSRMEGCNRGKSDGTFMWG
jgi:hypothetical protein